jgi:hypothetical protein
MAARYCGCDPEEYHTCDSCQIWLLRARIIVLEQELQERDRKVKPCVDINGVEMTGPDY